MAAQIQPSEYYDDSVLLSIEPPTESRPTLRLHAAGIGVAASVDLSATGASRLAELLRSAAVNAVAGGFGSDR